MKKNIETSFKLAFHLAASQAEGNAIPFVSLNGGTKLSLMELSAEIRLDSKTGLALAEALETAAVQSGRSLGEAIRNFVDNGRVSFPVPAAQRGKPEGWKVF